MADNQSLLSSQTLDKPSLNKPRRIQLRTILIVPFVLQLVIAIGLTGYLSFRNGQMAVNNVAEQLRHEVTARIATHLRTFLDTPQQINHINASLMRQGLLDVTDPTLLERHLWEQLQLFDTVTSIYFGNTKGGLVDAGREGVAGPQYVIITDNFESGSFRKYAIDSLGQRIELLTTVPNFDARTRPWYTSSVVTSEAAWSDVYLLFTGQDMAISASRPVYDEQDMLLGVVAVDIFVSQLANFLQTLKIGQNGQSFIIDRSGLLVASSTNEKPFTDPGGETPQRRLYAEESRVPLIQEAAKFLGEQFGNEYPFTDEQLLEFELEGQRHFLQVLPFQDQYGIDWLIVVIVPEADFMGQIQANNRFTAWLIIAALLIALGVGILTARWITRPILQLNTSAQSLVGGKWQPVITTDWINELSTLTNSFNKMAGQLQKTVAELTSEVNERQESEKRFRALIENALDIITVLEADGTIRFESPSIERILGYKPEALVGQNAFDYVHADDLPSVLAVFQQILQDPNISASVTFRFRHQDGSWRIFESIGRNLLGDPAVQGVVVNSRDLTERQQAEEALKESEARYQAVVDMQTELICRSKMDGTLTFVNDAYCRFFGKTPQQLIGANYKSFLHQKEDWQILYQKLTQLTVENPLSTAEHQEIRADGSLRWLLWTDRGIFDEMGQLLEIQSVGRDITQRKQAEAKLKESEANLRAIFNNSLQAFLLFDQQQRVIAFNTIAANWIKTLLGQEINKGDRANKLFAELQVVNFVTAFNQALHGKIVTRQPRVEIAGQHHWFETSYIPVLAENGSILGVSLSILNITDRKHLEEQLLHAQKMEAIGRLAGSVAHDFNNILTIISGTCGLILESLDADDDSLRPDIEQIKHAGERASDLTRQLLAFSRKQVLQLQVLNLNTLLTNVDKMLRRLIGEDIHLVTTFDDNLGKVKADPGQMEQVILNLAVNARDAMPHGGKLTLETANVYLDRDYAAEHVGVKPGPYVRLAVTDTGSGMEAKTKSQIFEPFFTTKAPGKGTGLGLATVHGIINQSGGHIWVYSEPGRGTTFKIYLSQVEASEPLLPTQPTPASSRGTETILLVEDEDLVRELARRILAADGYLVLSARNGAEAIQICEQHAEHIHLLFIDVVLTGTLSGPETAKQLSLFYPKIKVLYMSGYTDNAIVHHGVLAPQIPFLQKPFSPKGLLRKVREVLDEGEAR